MLLTCQPEIQTDRLLERMLSTAPKGRFKNSLPKKSQRLSGETIKNSPKENRSLPRQS
ncbi:hypothetical protein LEP1GSC039_2443 [Leptospira santarosai str. 2000027870]|nr:hypothetical protein LEP1GSC039_2443 [Leptospira santarosai str. 2000027870]